MKSLRPRPLSPERRRAALLAVPLLAAATNLMPVASARAGIVAALEEPRAGAGAAGVGNVRGWAFDDAGGTIVSPLEVRFDGLPSIEVPCCSSRADVRASFPAAPLRTGFSGVFNWALLAPGTHQISVRVESSSGARRDLTASFTTVRIGDQTFLSNLDLDNQLEGDCVNIESEICCDGVLAVPAAGGPGVPRTCHDVCWSWSSAAQGLVMTSAFCE